MENKQTKNQKGPSWSTQNQCEGKRKTVSTIYGWNRNYYKKVLYEK